MMRCTTLLIMDRELMLPLSAKEATAEVLRVLVLARSYPNNVLPTLGLWTERITSCTAHFCDVRVVSPVPHCPPLPPLAPLRQYTRFREVVARDVRGGIEVHHPRFFVGLGQSLHFLEGRSYYHGVRGAVDTIRASFPFDLIHAHFIYADGVAAHRLSRRYRVPFVVTEHAPWGSWLERAGLLRAAVEAAREASCIMAVSRYVRDTIVDYTGDPDRVRVIPNGVDERVFRPNGPSRERQILYVGLINFNKGIDTLLEAMRIVRGRWQDAGLVLVGGSFYRNTRLQQERLQALARELGLADCVAFVGQRPPEEVARFMRESAVVVLPSRAESFGSVLVEALACGTPVVASRSGGPEDIVDDEVGKLVPTGDPEALAQAIVAVLEQPDRYDAARLREHALRRFGWTTIERELREVYELAVDAHR